MKYKKIMLILITAIFLVSIAGVCASDANDTTVASEDTQMDLAQIDETDALGVNDDNQEIEQSENEEIIAQEDVGLSQELQNNITAVALEKTQDSDDERLGNPSSAEELTAGKTTPNIDLVVENITYGEVENITAFTEATGNVTIKINNQLEGIFNIDLGKVVHQVHLDAGKYTVELTYNGDDNYNNVTVSKEFSVYKANVSMDVEAEPYIDAGEIQTINITMSSANATDHVNIYLAGTYFWCPLFDGRGNFTTSALDSGKHQYVIIYEGDKNFNGTLHHGTFEVGVPSKMPVSFNVSVQDVDVGENAIVKILNLPDNATGYMVIKLNETGYGFDIDSNREFSIPINKAGTYEVFAVYAGDDRYDSGNASTSFRASKIQSKVIVEVDNLTYGDVAHINITVTTGATGNVTIKIGDEFNQTLGIVGGVINNVAVPGLTGGDKTVEVTYNGNDMYLPNSNSTDFTVGSAIAKIYLFTQNVTYGENETIIAYLDAEGNVTFKIDGQDYGTVNIADGKAVFTGPLESGKHTVKAVYNGGPNFSSNSIEAKFTVEKAIPTVSVDVQNIIFGGVEHIRVHVNAEGDVTIKVIGTGIVETISLENGEKDIILRGISSSGSDNYEGNATLNVYNLRGGRYPVEVTYLGNSNYKNLTVFSEFEVYKADTSMHIEAEPYIDAGEDQTINITLSSVKATGWVYVYLAGRVSPRPVFDGFANYTTPLLESGKYQYVIIYEGDENFKQYIARGTFEVGDVPSFKDVSIGLDVEPYLHAGETQVINITMSDSAATGRVTIILDNNNYTRILDNGFANFTTPVLPGGNYTVVVIYEGNYMFNSNWTYDAFAVETVQQKESPLDVMVDNIEVGGRALITVELPKNATGNVTVSIDGKPYYAEVSGGKAVLPISGLTAGNKTIAVVYSGDDDYVANSTIANMVVSKAVPYISIDVTTVGDSVIVNVTAPVDVAAPVLVAVDGVGYQVNITGGKGQLVVSGLAGGKHNVTARYLGDDNYNQSEPQSKSFEICNISSVVSVKVDNITYGDKAVIEVTVPADATGNVTVTIDGKEYIENVSCAKAIFIVAGLGAGNYTVDVTYNGDEKYASSDNSTELKVCPIKIDEKDIFVVDQGNGTVVVVVFKNAGGNITVKVGEHAYNSTLADGRAVINLDNETPGTHDVDVIYWGDENHEGNSTASTITIPKFESPISVDVQYIEYGKQGIVIVTLPENATGNVSIEIEGVRYDSEEIHDGVVEFSIKNLTAGSKTIAVDYAGDDNYIGNHTTANITVTKANPEIMMNVTSDGDTAIIDVTAPEDVAKPVVVDVDGVGYYANITSGKGQLVIHGMAGGWHDVAARYPGDDRYNQSEPQFKSFEICDVPSEVSAKVDNITYGDKAVIEVTVPADATGNVTVTIDGKEYIENVSCAKAIFIVAGLGAGNYTVDVTYDGDEKYASSKTSAELEVSKAKTFIKVIDMGNGTVIVVVSDNVSSNVTIKVGNNSYGAAVEDAIAMIDLVNETCGVHDIEVICDGDENHTAAYANASITLNKFKTLIIANAITTTYNVNKDLVISLIDVKGNPISGAKIAVDLNGVKTYTTDEKGNIKVSTKGLAPNTYAASITFDGNDNYEKSMGSVKVSVKKATPKITAKKKTFKAKTKTKKYSITLKDNAGKAMKKVKVTLKVKGKTYKATTNSKGKATFKIKNLNKKGKYIAAIKYNGDKNYNKVTKKVKLTVKSNKKKKSTFKTLSKGSKDKATIKKIQRALKNKEYYITYKGQYLKIDGIYHGHTERSVKEFQHDKGLKVTGKVDKKTAKKLGII